MRHWPQPFDPPCVTIHTFSVEALGAKSAAINAVAQATTSAVYPTANLAMFFPFEVMSPLIAVQMFAYSGATVDGSGKIDVGIYDLAGTRIVSSGSVVQTSANDLQAFDVADTLLNPGIFYFGVSLDNTTNTLFRNNSGGQSPRAWGIVQQATAHPLPAVATFAQNAQAFIPIIGLSTRSVL